MYTRNKLVHSVGINDADYPVAKTDTADGKTKQVWMCPYYNRWKSMLERCYSNSYQNKFPSYVGCVVCEEWLTFSNFKSWMEKQDWQGKQLDKDLLGDGKIYSPDVCCFISDDLNKFLTFRKSSNKGLPSGVSKIGNSFKVQISNPILKKISYFGCYKTTQDALDVWVKQKMAIAENIQELSDNNSLLCAVKQKIREVNNSQV